MKPKPQERLVAAARASARGEISGKELERIERRSSTNIVDLLMQRRRRPSWLRRWWTLVRRWV